MSEFNAETPDFPKTEEFLGGGGYADQIYKKAVKIRGEYELHYIPEDSEVSWAAGMTWNQILELPEDKQDQFWNYGMEHGGYATKDNGQPPSEQPYLGTAAEWQQVRDDLKWARDWWDDQLGPDPDTFDSTIKDYGNAAKALYDESSGVQAAGSNWYAAGNALEGWQSVAGRTFRNNVWYRMPSIVRRQSAVASILAHSIAAERDAWLQHRKTHKEFAEKTLTALDAVKVQAADNASAEQTILAGVFTAAAGMLAIPFTGGATTPMVLAGLSTAAAGVFTVAAGESTMKDDERKKVSLGDDNVSGVLINMASAGTNADMQVDDDEELIVESLMSVYERLSDNTSQESASDIPAEDLPPGVQPGDMDEPTWTPREKFVFPRPNFVDAANDLPDPPIPT